jgi:hypothetical protein
MNDNGTQFPINLTDEFWNSRSLNPAARYGIVFPPGQPNTTI